MHRNTYASIDLAAIKANYRYAQQLSDNASCLAVVKADAYGHGLATVAAELEPLAPALGVAILDEALMLRDAGIKAPIVILEGVFDEQGLAACVEHGFWPMLHQRQQLNLLETSPKAPHCWLKFDTGMHRLGLSPAEVQSAVELVTSATGTTPVVCTHFACADEPESAVTQGQYEGFYQAMADIKCPMSLANSAAVMAHPDAHADWNRPGLMLYGCSPFISAPPQAAPLQPAMTLTSEIIALREVPDGDGVGYGLHWRAKGHRRIATVAIGYADGYPRTTTSQCRVWLNGHYARVVGTVSMDMITVDVTDIANVSVGDSVELWGRHVSINEVAKHANTIPYELLTRVSQRVPRRYR